VTTPPKMTQEQHAADHDRPSPVCIRKTGGRPNWIPMFAIVLLHVGALLAIFPAFFSWKAVLTAVVLQGVCVMGITVGYHRLLTHRSFATIKPIEYLLSWLGSLSWQGGPIKWVATHRLHHQHSDDDEDPHTPRHGFFWSHTLWCFTFDPSFDSYDKYSLYAKDLAKDKGQVFLERTTPLWQPILAGLLFLWGGWPCVIWGVFVRLVYVYHVTWLVNSATHTWGYRNYETEDLSRNLWWVGLLALGEGWHNNHHAFPTSARHGLKPWEIDFSWILIRSMSWIGLASAIRLPGSGAARMPR